MGSNLALLCISGGNKSPVLIPYPDLETNKLITEEEKKALKDGELPHKIGSVFRVRVDACDRLWVMDSGLADLKGNTQFLGPAKLLIYDLKTDKLLRQYAFSRDVLKEDSFFANVVSERPSQVAQVPLPLQCTAVQEGRKLIWGVCRILRR